MEIGLLKMRLAVTVLLGAVAVLLWFCPASPALDTVPTGVQLTDEHCILCHSKEPTMVAVHGGKHKTEVGCLDCHREHPPEGTGAVPECGMCHTGKDHYALDNCAGCHTSGHAPGDLQLEGELTEPCLTCHAAQGVETSHHPSAHADMACNDCHGTHREVPSCLDCHSGHTEDMAQESCASCHPAHKPLVVKYERGTPSSYCQSCHGEAYDMLQANTSKHNQLACDECHRSEHKAVPPCFACHGKPHPKEMLDKFDDCSDCHGTAHDLRR